MISAYSRFGSIWFLSKKITKPNFFLKKPKPNRNRFKPTGFGSVWFFRAKTGSNRFGSVFSGLVHFFRFGSVFSVCFGFVSVWLGFFGSGSVRFGFSGSRLKKPKPNRTGRYFQNFNRFNRFFFTVRFFRLFFFQFSRFNRFFGFFEHPYICPTILLLNPL